MIKGLEDSGAIRPKTHLRAVNAYCPLAIAVYFYDNPAYSRIYGIIRLYQNYPNWPRTSANNQFNKAMSRFHINIEHGFTIHQNFWM